MDNRKEIIEHFKKAVSAIWARDGQNTWPIEINSIVHLFMDIFFAELLQDMNRLKVNGFEKMGIAEKFKTSARIIRLIMPCVLGMKGLGLPIKKQREHVIYLLSLVRKLKYGDLYNRDGKNIIFSPGMFERIVDPSKMIPAGGDRKSSLLAHKLCAVLWNYAETLCFKTHGLIREFHGPYRLPGKNEEILIRDFNSLNPLELWDECKAVKYGNIRVVTAYENLDMTIDIYNNVSIKPGSTYIDNLKYYYIERDGKVLNQEKIENLFNILSATMISITTKIESLDWRQLAQKYAEIFWFSKKELRDEFELDWRIPPIVKKRIKNGKLDTRLQGLSPRALQRMLRIAF